MVTLGHDELNVLCICPAGCDLCGGEHDTENCPELAMDELEQVLKASTLTR